MNRFKWIVLAAALFAGTVAAQGIVFLSTQLAPIEEAQKMRNDILRNFVGSVDFITDEAGPFVDRVTAETTAGRGTVSLLGTLHGDYPNFLAGAALQPLDDLMGELEGLGFQQVFMDLGKLGTDSQYYIPWMQATYFMAANVKALPYLPAGADLQALTYSELGEWAKNVHDATGERLLGFPGGGLMHRFFQGYLVPSYTGGVVTEYRSAAAETMWNDFKAIWAHVNPRSTTYAFMQEPLLAEEVWIAFDHTARLLDALNQRPDDFVTFPAPAGPAGRGFMPVLAGLAIPTTSPDVAGARELIKYLSSPEVQVSVLQAGIGFFPVVAAALPDDLPRGIQLAGAAIGAQSGSPDAIASLLPVGLGGLGGEFNKVFMDTFTRIVLRGENVRTVLDQEAVNLQNVMTQAGAACWAPDPASQGACQVK
jgi:multiple sugar transport system substrate-binding protein